MTTEKTIELTDSAILEMGHRRARTYRHSDEPQNIGYGFDRSTLLDFARASIQADRAQRQDAETWSLYIASMVEAYLQSQPAADKRESAIAGIISRRLWALPDRAQRQAVQEPYAYAVYFPDQPTEELVHDLDALADDLTNRHHTITSLYTAAPQPAQVPLTEPSKLTREQWNKAYAAHIVLRAGWTMSDAEEMAGEADEFFNDDYAPDEAADEELSNWTD